MLMSGGEPLIPVSGNHMNASSGSGECPIWRMGLLELLLLVVMFGWFSGWVFLR